MRLTRHTFGGALLAFIAPLTAHAASPYYVAPTGSDTAAGTIDAPWASMKHAQTVAVAGDTVYFRAGKYAYTAGLTACTSQTATINAILVSTGGKSGAPIKYWAYPGEVPVFDFSGIKDSCRVTGFRVTGSWLYFKGLEVTGVPQNNTMNHESWGMWNSGSNNTYELINAHDNMGPGIFLQDGGNNLILNCDSHDNYDPNSSDGNGGVSPGQNADGFGCHIGAGGTGNVFRGCRSWRNSDDGWDFIQAQEVVTVENSWAWDMGYHLVNGTLTSAADGNGNGFKGGGYGEPPTNVPGSPPSHIIQHCLSVANKASGFYANHEPVGDHWYNNTGYGNHPNFNLLGDPANVGTLKNNIAFSGTALSNNTGTGVVESFNSWDTGFTVAAADLQNATVTGLDAPRQADGSLPELTNFHLAAGSKLIDAGTNVGLPYNGTAPDLGAFETGPSLGGTGGTGAGGTGGAGGAGGTGGNAGKGGTSAGGSAGKGGTSAGGTSAGGTSAGGMSAGGMSAGGTSAGGTSAGGTSAGGTSAGGTSAGGTSAGANGVAGVGGDLGTAGGGAGALGSGGFAGGVVTGAAGGSPIGTGVAGGATVSSNGGSGGALGSGAGPAAGDSSLLPTDSSNDSAGCSCRTAGGQRNAPPSSLLSLLALLALRRRKRTPSSPR